MQRILLEWSGIAFAFAACGGFAFWLVSSFSQVADFELTFGGGSSFFQVAGSDGELLFCDSLANLEVINLVDRGIAIEPPVTSDAAWNAPGLHYRRIQFGQRDSPLWATNVSCLIPSIIAAILAASCFLRLRTRRRKFMASRSTSA